MNCIDFRRDALAQPLRLAEPALAHTEGCASCLAFLERQRRLDADLSDALQVPVPDGLADRIVLASGLRGATRPSWAWAAAAIVVLAAGVAVLFPSYLGGNALAYEAIAHVHEEAKLVAQVSSHPSELLRGELAAQGIRLAAALGEVTYAKVCPMKAGQARHLVVATKDGPVTLLLLPADEGNRRRTVVESDGMTAIALPASRGSIAIVAATREQALAAERMLVLA